MTEAIKYDKRKYKNLLSVRKKKISSIEALNNANAENKENLDILFQAQQDWESLAEFRERAMRCIRYADGDQWEDIVSDPDREGRLVKEKDLIVRQGKVPLVQNKIGALVRNIMGQYRSNADKSVVLVRDADRTEEEEVLTEIISSVSTANQLDELDSQMINVFLHSGAEMQRISYRYIKELDRNEVYVENVDFNHIFFNPNVKDLRLNDLCRIGMFHELNKYEFLSKFAKTEADVRWLTEKFDSLTINYYGGQSLIGKTQNPSFIQGTDNNGQTIRVFECWTLEADWSINIFDPATGAEGITDLTENQIKIINQRRIRQVEEFNATVPPEQQIPQEDIAVIEYEKQIDSKWVYRYMLYDGTLLQKGVTPYQHQEHPFVLRLYPLVAGNVYGLTYQMIDQQRMINRMTMLWDFLMSAGAKGVLMIPSTVLGNKTPDEFAKAWIDFRGVIVYTPDDKNPAAMPQQITANSVPVGVVDMLNMQLRLIEDISGVHGAIQGKQAQSGVSGKLYQQETLNASLNTLDVMKINAAFKRVRDRKILKTALQFYNGKRKIISSKINGGVIIYDPVKIRDIDFDIQIIQNTDTPAYRSMVEDRLLQMVQAQIIPVEAYLESSSDPTIKRVFEVIKQKAQQQQAQMPQQAGGDINEQQALEQLQSNPQAMQMLQQAVGVGQQQ